MPNTHGFRIVSRVDRTEYGHRSESAAHWLRRIFIDHHRVVSIIALDSHDYYVFDVYN